MVETTVFFIGPGLINLSNYLKKLLIFLTSLSGEVNMRPKIVKRQTLFR